MYIFKSPNAAESEAAKWTLCDLNLDLTRVSQHFTNSMAPSLAYPGPTESRDIKLPSSTNPRQFD